MRELYVFLRNILNWLYGYVVGICGWEWKFCIIYFKRLEVLYGESGFDEFVKGCCSNGNSG